MMKKKQILVVEDNMLNREILVDILSEEYDVLEAENGKEALSILHREKEEVALILLDVQMPVMDGFTFLERAKVEPELALIPVIVMTQGDSEADELNALSHGATDFVPKPYRPKIILHRISSLINFRETAAMANQFKYDRLTGMYSKDYFCQLVREVLRQNPDQEYDIVCSDIENFKLFNDSFGVEAGDRLLREMAGYFMERTKENEIFSRFGADHFIWIRERSEEYDDEMFLEVARHINDLPNAKNLSLKWGIYRITDRSVEVEQMCDRVLLAADSIKGQYHKYFAVYNDILRDKLLREQSMADEMEVALLEGQFDVYFQPKINLMDGTLSGAEALVRWIHPEKGFISPGEFIPLFERNGFITRLDQFVWERTCLRLKQWKEKGYGRLPVSVNVSRADFYQTDLCDILLELIRKYDLQPSDLHLEITESAYMENPRQILSIVHDLRNLGFILEMDDFGSGYSSLNMLNQMELDVIKLDMNFVRSETVKPANQGILRYIVELAHSIHLSVVAEGIETQDQLMRLKSLGCDYGQGYFFSPPVTGEVYDGMLKEQKEKGSKAVKQENRDESRIRHILVVDDDPSYREVIERAFGAEYRIWERGDADSAVSLLMEQSDRVSIVILSMLLPENSSFEVLKLINENRKVWGIPVLATGTYNSALEKAALKFGADDYVGKSGDGYSLKRRMERIEGWITYRDRESQLLDEVFRDYLTGLLNRRGLHAAIKSLQQQDFPLAVYFFDLDDLKKINDQSGHETGDRVLRSFGRILRHYTRNTDILARYGGDEFVMILKNVPSKEFALKKGEDICRLFRDSQTEELTAASCSSGIVLCGGNEKLSPELFQRADRALYRAKAEHKGGCCLWRDVNE